MPELATLRRTLIAWLATAQTAGLDEDGMVALFTSVMRDFFKSPGQKNTTGGRSEGVA
jgi:GntR family transcriptional regulator